MGTRSEGLVWQTGVWNKISDIYQREIDSRFAPVVRSVVSRATLRVGDSVLDMGTGTGSLALEASAAVGAGGHVTAIDISEKMLEVARRRARELGGVNIDFREGQAEKIPAEDAAFDAICSSLCFQYVIDRAAAAADCARVLKPGGRLVASVWAGPEEADIVRFQSTAGRFAPPPPVPGVGPGALADTDPFVDQLRRSGIDVRVETEITKFEFPNFEMAWDVLAGVTTATLPPEKVAEAKAAVCEAMWPDPDSSRVFSNKTHFIVGRSPR